MNPNFRDRLLEPKLQRLPDDVTINTDILGAVERLALSRGEPKPTAGMSIFETVTFALTETLARLGTFDHLAQISKRGLAQRPTTTEVGAHSHAAWVK